MANNIRLAWGQQHAMTREVPISRSYTVDTGSRCACFQGKSPVFRIWYFNEQAGGTAEFEFLWS